MKRIYCEHCVRWRDGHGESRDYWLKDQDRPDDHCKTCGAVWRLKLCRTMKFTLAPFYTHRRRRFRKVWDEV